MVRELMDSVPLWNILVFTLVTVLIAIEVGYRVGRWRNRHYEFDSEALLSAMTGAHLALLAFIMAFSFSMAAGHHADRKRLIMDEANIVGTAFLRSELVREPYSSKIGNLLREYTALRLTIGPEVDPDQVIAESEALHGRLWDQVRLINENSEPGEIEALLVESINNIFDVHERRVAAGLRNRVQPSLWVALFALLMLSMAGIGYFSGIKGHRNPIASTGLALSFSMVMFLIADLDRPSGGLVLTDTSVMASLNQRLK